MSIMSKLKKRIQKITKVLLGIVLVGGLLVVNYMAKSVASPAASEITYGAELVLAKPGIYGLKVESLDCLDGKVPTMVVEPESDSPVSKKGEIVRCQILERGATLTEYSEISGTVVILHGRNGRKEHAIGIAERFCALGLRCILVDLPSHGESPVAAVKFGSDAWEQDLAYAALMECAEEFGFDTENVALWGMSMGGSFAVAAAADPETGHVWDSVTIVCSLDKLAPVIQKKCKFGWLTKLTSRLCEFHGGADFYEVTPVKWAEKVTLPVLVVHGDSDELIPAVRGKFLYEGFSSVEKKWVTVEGGTHENILITKRPLYAEMGAWILEHF